MEIVATGVEVIGAHGPLLAPTSLRVRSGRIRLVTGDSGTSRSALALALSGRIKPSNGGVLLDERSGAAELRRTVAVVDAPQITAPDDALQVRDVVAEGLCIAGRPSSRRKVRAWIDARELPATERIENLPAQQRTRLLVELARASQGIRALVLDSPDRHGGNPHGWHELAAAQAERGLAVVAICSPHSADALGVPAARIGADDNETSVTEGVR